MQAAAPGQILVTEATIKQTGDKFSWEALPPIRVKGKAEPLSIYAVTRRQAQTAVRLQEPQYALPMVGRAAEQQQILEKWQR